MSLIEVKHLSFAYDGGEEVFSDVSFSVDSEWKLGFCGRNGRGKTTFLRLMMGELEYRGRIVKSVECAYFPCPVEDPGQMSIELLEEIAPQAELWQLRRELSKLGLDDDALYRHMDTLSGGERTKVLLAGLFLKENAFLLIDEPTNHLDALGRRLVAKYLSGKRGFLLVSHDRAFLDACTDHTLAINKTNIEVINGNFSVWWEQKLRQDQFELDQNARLNQEIDRLKAAAARSSRWSDKAEAAKHQPQSSGLSPDKGYIGHKAAKVMKRSMAAQRRLEGAAEEKSKLLHNLEAAESIKMTPLIHRAQRLVAAQGVTIRYGQRVVCSDLNFCLNRGERLLLKGGNGTGKSSVLKLICGEALEHSGALYRAGGLVISAVPQDAGFLQGDLRSFISEHGLDEALFKMMLRKLDFSREQFDRPMQCYSAGQKKKVLLARSLCDQAHVYVWDEPLNFVDVFARVQLEELILNYQPTMLFVEHDAVFCENIATKEIIMNNEQ